MRDYEISEGLPRMLIDNSNNEIKIQPLKAKVNKKSSIIPEFLLHQSQNNIKLNRSFFSKVALEKEEKYDKFEEKDHVIWSNGGREAGQVRKGWSRFAIRRFNIIYQQVDLYMKDNRSLFDSVDRMMTKWWILRKGVKRTGTKRKLDSDRAEGYDSMEKVVMGKFSEV